MQSKQFPQYFSKPWKASGSNIKDSQLESGKCSCPTISWASQKNESKVGTMSKLIYNV